MPGGGGAASADGRPNAGGIRVARATGAPRKWGEGGGPPAKRARNRRIQKSEAKIPSATRLAYLARVAAGAGGPVRPPPPPRDPVVEPELWDGGGYRWERMTPCSLTAYG